MKKIVLLISRHRPQAEDTPDFHSDLRHHLKQDDRLLIQVERWEESLSIFEAEPPDAIILYCFGTGVDGLTDCQKIRTRYAGLLVLVSEQGDEQFHRLALDLGADASLPAVAGASLLAANVGALLRRFVPAGPPSTLTFVGLTVDAARRDVFIANRPVRLSTIEFQILWILALKPGCVITRDEIYRELYAADYNGYDRGVDVYVSRIRQKISDDPTTPRYLKTVRGIGYQFMGGPTRVTPVAAHG